MTTSKQATSLLITLSDKDLSSLIYENVTQAILNLSSQSTSHRYGTEDEIIDGKTLMIRLDISEPTLQRWRDKNKIPYIQEDNVIRYNWPKVLEALENKKRRGR